MLKTVGVVVVVAVLMAGGVYLLSSGGPIPAAGTAGRSGVTEQGSRPAAAPQSQGGSFVLPAISPQEAYRRWRDNPAQAILLDVRTIEEYEKWNIPGAVHVPVADSNFGRLVESKLPNKNVDVFVFCRTGRRCKPAADILHRLGYGKLYNMGGIIDWPYETDGSDS